MIKMATLVSGSSGNSTFLSYKDTSILIDCGVSGKCFEKQMEQIGENPSNIDLILVTHGHKDHVGGIGIISRKYDIPICATLGTWNEMSIGKIAENNQFTLKGNKPFAIGEIEIYPFDIPHDTEEPVAYSFKLGDKKISVLTDLGCITDIVRQNVIGSETVILESNHDLNMLQNGKYPEMLKRRVKGNFGHLSNAVAGEFASDLVKSGTKNIVLGHLSQENNEPQLAYKTVCNCLKQQGISVENDILLSVASRFEVTKIAI